MAQTVAQAPYLMNRFRGCIEIAVTVPVIKQPNPPPGLRGR